MSLVGAHLFLFDMLTIFLVCLYIIFIKCIQTLVYVHVYYVVYYSTGNIQYSVYRRTFNYYLVRHDSRFSYVLECTSNWTDYRFLLNIA